MIESDTLFIDTAGNVKRQGVGPVVATLQKLGPPASVRYRCVRTGPLRSGEDRSMEADHDSPLAAVREAFHREDTVAWALSDTIRNGTASGLFDFPEAP